MLIDGCCCGGERERGALGFSNEKSLMYCVSTLSCGTFSGAGPPFVVVMGSPTDATGAAPAGGNTGRPGRQPGIRLPGIGDQASGIRDRKPDYPLRHA